MADGLYIPDFDQDEEVEPEGVEKEEGPNRTFLIGAIALAAVFVVGICLVVAIFVLRLPQRLGLGGPTEEQAQATAIAISNATSQWFANETATADAAMLMTQGAVPAEQAGGEVIVVPTEQGAEEMAITPTATPTTSLVVTVIEGGETPTAEGGIIEETPAETEVAEITAAPTSEEEEEPTPLAPATTATVSAGITPTSRIVGEATPLGGEATPTREVSGVGEEEGEEEEGGVTPTGVGGPIEPTLPTTGVATNTSLAGLVLLGVALVAVVIIVRRLRLH